MRTLPDSRGSSTCTDEAGRSLLLPYALRGATVSQELLFERHLLECDLCYADFLAVWRASEIVASAPPGTTPETRAPDGPVDARSTTGRGASSRRGVVVMWTTVAFVAGLLAGGLI